MSGTITYSEENAIDLIESEMDFCAELELFCDRTVGCSPSFRTPGRVSTLLVPTKNRLDEHVACVAVLVVC